MESIVCRSCLSDNGEIFHLFTTIIAENNDILVGDIFREVTNMKVKADDEFPQFICINCFEMLKISYKFKRQCEESITTLKQALIPILNSNVIRFLPLFFFTNLN